MAATITIDTPVPAAGWLRGATFDVVFTVGTAALALCAGASLTCAPLLFPLLLFLDLWLLGYHHVVSTFTRLTFDADSFKSHRFLVLVLPWVVLAAVAAVGYAGGVWPLVTIYFYWQWWHYTRQSYGVSRIYQRKAGRGDRLANYVIYATAVCGVLYRSSQAPTHFLGAEFRPLPVPGWVVGAALAAAAVVTGLWLLRQGRDLLESRFAPAHFLYVVTHVAVFAAGYLLIEDLAHGWLVVNIWHNAQYVLTVWLFNNNRFKGEVHPRHRFLSTLSRRKNFTFYVLFCLAISTAVYVPLAYASDWLGAAGGLTLVVGAYQVINFHHYIVDAVIWKTRKQAVRQNLGVAG